MHETGGLSHIAQPFNLAGIRHFDPQSGQYQYDKFGSLQEFAEKYASVLSLQRYSGLSGAKDLSQFADILKRGGYYSDSESNYLTGLQRWDSQYGGAAMQVTIGSINVPVTQPNATPQQVKDAVQKGVTESLKDRVWRNMTE